MNADSDPTSNPTPADQDLNQNPTPPAAPAAPAEPIEQAPVDPAAPAAPAEATAPQSAPRMSAFQRGALRALGIGELVQRVEAAEATVAQLTAENARLSAQNAELTAEIPRREMAARAVRENEVSSAARTVLSSLGVSEADAPAQMPIESTPAALLEKFKTLTGAEKTAFFRAHKSELKAAELAASAPAPAKK